MTVTLLFEYNSPEGMWYTMHLAFEYFYFFVQIKLLFGGYSRIFIFK